MSSNTLHNYSQSQNRPENSRRHNVLRCNRETKEGIRANGHPQSVFTFNRTRVVNGLPQTEAAYLLRAALSTASVA